MTVASNKSSKNIGSNESKGGTRSTTASIRNYHMRKLPRKEYWISVIGVMRSLDPTIDTRRSLQVLILSPVQEQGGEDVRMIN